jgi:hypothetical protein
MFTARREHVPIYVEVSKGVTKNGPNRLNKNCPGSKSILCLRSNNPNQKSEHTWRGFLLIFIVAKKYGQTLLQLPIFIKIIKTPD